MTKQNSEKGGLGTKVVIIIIAAVMLSAALMPFADNAEADYTALGDAGDIWDGTVAAAFSDGDGSSTDPFMICDGTELARMRADVNAGINANSYYKLANDIYLNNTGGWEDWDTIPPVNSWTPIGTSADPFKGNFDGDGYAVYGIYIPVASGAAGDYKGLFGYVNNGTISDLGIEQSYIGGRNYVGGIAGHIRNYSEITNCYNAATVQGTGFRIGGIAGQVYDHSVVTYCYNVGAISGISASSNSIGGIVGILNVSSVLANCYNMGDIEGDRVGGVAGQMNNLAVLINCYNAGLVKGTNAGGVVGYTITSQVQNVYNTGMVDSATGGNIIGANSTAGTTAYDVYYLIGSGRPTAVGGVADSVITGSSDPPFDIAGDLTSGGTLKDAMNAGQSAADTLLASYGIVCDDWIGDKYPILASMAVKVSLLYSDNGTASISPAEDNLAKGTAFTVTVAPGTDCIKWTVKDNGVLVLDDTDATFTYKFVAHKGHLIDVSFKVEETGPVIGPIPDPDVKGGTVSATFLVILAALIIFGVLFIGWLYKRRKDEEDPK